MRMVYYMATLCFCFSIDLMAQTVPPVKEQQLENMTAAEETEIEDDSYMQQLTYYKKHPLNINMATADELQGILLLTDLQIQHFIHYRNVLGKLVHLYELQAVPTWDIVTIRKLLPYITLEQGEGLVTTLWNRLKDGEHHVIIRASQVMERAKGFDKSSSGTKYLGSEQRFFLRYRYMYKNLLQYGITADKDAGEQFFKGAQSKGLDFYSVHFFARNIGMVKALAIGDFTVNMGQGLIQWQSLAFKKSVDISAIKRQSPVLRPYTSAGEYNFNRGVGITLQKRSMAVSFFASVRRLSANMVQGADSADAEDYFSSFVSSGYHRTAAEAAGKNQLQQISYGGNIKYHFRRGYVGVNGLVYRFSTDLQKRDAPYNYFSVSGKDWWNGSIDYGWTYKNIHFFGEAAIDKRLNMAFVNGLMVSVDRTIDVAVLQRTIDRSYQAINGNAFTENAFPTNERGYYAGISLRPATGLRLDGYADLFSFPWLRYLVDAPSNGSEYAVQLTYTPSKTSECYLRFRKESKQVNQPDNTSSLNYLVYQNRVNWRLHLQQQLNKAFMVRSRVEWLQFDRDKQDKEQGILYFIDVLYKPLMKPVSAGMRLQYFETDSYYSRVYAFENDVLYSYSIPVFYDKGYRYYVNINYDITRKLTIWLRWAQMIYADKQRIGSGLDEIAGNRKSELKLQLSLFF
jgi:hypothetical protein